ncbi:hypothetical protein HaLaN_26672 [Haematococcus lacustris]|uniref:Uncharacterized protein n=1 Tax=Haematococcus lacustris TaxID=44745 RepID=A0A6A0A6S9_HAELA|nr:hypothetical protein HaLaN_26672 [Haematococcus lacustris]
MNSHELDWSCGARSSMPGRGPCTTSRSWPWQAAVGLGCWVGAGNTGSGDPAWEPPGMAL